MSVEANLHDLPFEQQMFLGDIAHSEGKIPAALQYAAAAYLHAEPKSVDQGRAARGIAARYERLDNDTEANRLVSDATNHSHLPRSTLAWLRIATDIHTQAHERDPHDVAAVRELSQDHMYLGLLAAKRLIRREIAGGEVDATQYNGALTDLEDSLMHVGHATEMRKRETGREVPIDQYKINLLARLSIVHGVGGDRRRGQVLAHEARKIAPLSESLQLDTSNHDLTDKQRAAAVHRATQRAHAALAVNYTPRRLQQPFRRRIILPLALKVL